MECDSVMKKELGKKGTVGIGLLEIASEDPLIVYIFMISFIYGAWTYQQHDGIWRNELHLFLMSKAVPRKLL